MQLIRSRLFIISLFLIILISFGLRFYNYNNRWGLAYDQAHDAVLARYAVETFKIPLVGPFSSGAQFQTSGIWYWFLMLAIAVYPNSILSPWIAITTSYALFVFLMIKIGQELVDWRFGLIVGLLTAISAAEIGQSVNLSLTAPMNFVSAFAILWMIKFLKTKKWYYLLLLGFFTGLGPTVHLQGVLLILPLFIVIVFSKTFNVRLILLTLLAFILPWIPLIIFDLKNNFVNIKGLIDHFLYNQYRVSYEQLGRRWLTYILEFWPKSWGYIAGGTALAGGFEILGLSLLVSIRLFKKKLSLEWLVLVISFITIVIAMRYVRTPIFDSYLVFLHPYIFLFTGWIFYELFKLSKITTVILLAYVLIATLSIDIRDMTLATNIAAKDSHDWEKHLVAKFPKEKYAVYDYDYEFRGKSLPLVLFLQKEQLLSDKGKKVGVSYATDGAMFKYAMFTKINDQKEGFLLLDISSSKEGELKKAGWKFVNPSQIYKSTEDWHTAQ